MHTLSERMGWQNGLVKFVEWGVGLYVLLKIGGAYRRRRAFRKALQTGKRLIDSLADRLQIRRKQLVFQNAYGTTIYDKWNKEKSDFVKREVYACFAKAGYEKYFEKATPLLLTYLDQVAFTEPRAVPVKSSNPDIYSPDMDPFDYERYCAKLLRKSGWEAIVTSECGDQGADIVASKKACAWSCSANFIPKPWGMMLCNRWRQPSIIMQAVLQPLFQMRLTPFPRSNWRKQTRYFCCTMMNYRALSGVWRILRQPV